MTNHPLEDLIADYLAQKDIAPRSYDLYHTLLKQFMRYLIENQVVYAHKSDVIGYIDQLTHKAYSARWINHQISALKGLYRYLSENQARLNLPLVYEENIMQTIKNVKIPTDSIKPVLTISQAKQLLLHTKNNRKYIWHFRDYAMIYLMLTSGMRSVEITRAKIKDIRVINHEVVLYVQGKGHSTLDAFVKLTQGVKDAIDDYLAQRKDTNPYLFISHSKKLEKPYLSRTFFKRTFERILKEANMQDIKITPHMLRHGAATFHLLSGASLSETRAFMRHTSLSSTLIYAHHLRETGKDTASALEAYIMSDKDQTR